MTILSEQSSISDQVRVKEKIRETEWSDGETTPDSPEDVKPVMKYEIEIKTEPLSDEISPAEALVKEESVFLNEERVKEEWSDSTARCGVSEAAMLADLYIKHEVKDELVLGPERPHRPVVAPAALSYRVAASALVSPAAVLGVRRTSRISRRTYKLRAAEPSHTPSTIATDHPCHHCSKLFRNEMVFKKHVYTHSSLHNATSGEYGLKQHQTLHNKWIAWLDAVEGHPLLCPRHPSGDLGKVLLSEFCILTFYAVTYELSPSGLFWRVNWVRFELDWLWVELDLVAPWAA